MSRVIGTLLALLAQLAAPLSHAASPEATAVEASRSADANQRVPVILVFGDSLSAGYGVPVGYGWVSLLAQKIAQEGYDFRVVNASVSGETTTGGLARLPRALQLQQPRIVILELGANDGLRGLPVARARANLDQMLALSRSAGAKVLLLGMRMPPNYGERYTSAFYMMYAELSRAHGTALVPFFLTGVALEPGLIQADGLHPNERAQPLLLDNIWPALQPLLAPHRSAVRATGTVRPHGQAGAAGIAGAADAAHAQ